MIDSDGLEHKDVIVKPDFVTKWHLEYLDNLLESGVTNMFGAAPYLREMFPHLTEEESRKALVYWMKTFSERHKDELK